MPTETCNAPTAATSSEKKALFRCLRRHTLFECSFEVASKVGGIYTVLRTKAPHTVAEYGAENYFCVGLQDGAAASAHANACETEAVAIGPLTPNGQAAEGSDFVQRAVQQMRDEGVGVFYGKWLIDASPNVILFDVRSVQHRLDEWRAEMWNAFGIACPTDDAEVTTAVAFGFLTAQLLQRAAAAAPSGKRRIVAHFHEWLAAVGCLLVRRWHVPAATVFTTHATLLGRYLCAGSADFYNSLHAVSIDEEAGRRGIYHRYCIERAAAHSADVFTSVSHITAYEAEHLLKRRVDGVLPNGLNVVKSSAMHELQNKHAMAKQKIHAFIQSHFYGHLHFAMDDVLYFFTAGRYEFRNKGFDMFLEALARLNTRLKHFNSRTIVVAFIIVPGGVRSYGVDTLKGHAVTRQLNATVEELQAKIGRRIFDAALRGRLLSGADLMTDEEIVHVKRSINALRKESPPSVVTHNMLDDADDAVLRHIRALNLCNWDSDNVKIVFHPEFLSPNSPILSMEYDEFARGCHLGVFPSYYEPWGYTPAECTVLGVPSITTNLSGFGCFMEERVKNPAEYGIFIVDRRLKSPDESINQLTDYMFAFCQKTKRQRINLRNRTERLSEFLDWKKLGAEYTKARRLALYEKFFKHVSLDAAEFSNADEYSDDDDDADEGVQCLKAVAELSLAAEDVDYLSPCSEAISISEADAVAVKQLDAATSAAQ